jgi:hypothetical protein
VHFGKRFRKPGFNDKIALANNRRIKVGVGIIKIGY